MMKSSAHLAGWISGLLVGLTSLAGCETNSRLDEHYGDAVRANRIAMTANPDAGMQPNDGVTELEGATVEATLDRYRRTQTEPADTDMPTSILIQGGIRGFRGR